MAFFLQIRALRKQVKQQLDDFNDAEKSAGSPIASPRLSGDTTRGNSEAEPGQKPDADASSQKEKDENKDKDYNEKDWPYAKLNGISVESTEKGEKYYEVSFEGDDDPENPKNWSTTARLGLTFILILIAFEVTAASSIDSGVQVPAAKDLGVSEVVEALGGTGMYLVGFGVGALIASPASEMVGRYPVYLTALIIFGCWLIGAALSPNIGAQIVFRFLAGLSGSAPLTVSGGSISDLWTPLEKTWTFPLFALIGFGGPVLGPVMSGFIPVTGVLSWRWAEWIMLIADGLIITIIIAFKKETMAPQILKYKAMQFRKLTGDDRFKSSIEAQHESTFGIIKRNFTRPFTFAKEPIIFLFTLYLTIIYIVLFTFLDGYSSIFEKTYGINTGLSNLCFLGLLVGIMSSVFLIPIVLKITKKQLARDGDDGSGSALNQETRLIFAMVGAPLIPIGLFWMGWTDYAHISIWSPIVASGVIGLGIVTIFMSAYMYIIDSYEVMAASALTFVALVRYLAAGGMTVVGVPMYKNLGTHYTLTVLACISAVVVPIPYVLYIYGEKVRSKSKYAVSK